MMEVIIRAVRLEADNVVSLELARLDGFALPAFEAGAHIDVHLAASLVRH
jgi:vanillate O-demethylase ferredoxin subunit